MVPEYRSYRLDAARRQLTDVMPSSAATDVTLHVAAGPAAQTIRAYAADRDADLIVMGRSQRFMHLGSTAVRVLRNTDRALLIVPPSASAQTMGVEQSVHTIAA
jgi:nucleotide-binding universal stress UspA family protein